MKYVYDMFDDIQYFSCASDKLMHGSGMLYNTLAL